MFEWFYNWIAKRSPLYQTEVAKREDAEREADRFFFEKGQAEGGCT